MSQLILHIPHSSTKIPLKDGYVVNDAVKNSEILKLTDWYTDDLFFSDRDIMVVADFSRLFCDPERFEDDSQEIMSQYGMGVLYEKTDIGEPLRIVSPELRKKILTEYYWKHHNKFNEAVKKQLKEFSRATIIDCHSFPNIPFVRDLNKDPARPDFNIGTDPYHTHQKLIAISTEFFKDNGYSLGINWPYSGSIVPLEYYQKNKNVQSIMLEINRRLYLKEPSNEKSGDYSKIKRVTKEYVDTIETYLTDLDEIQ